MPDNESRPKSKGIRSLPFDTTILGQSLRPISSDVMKTEAHNLVSQWYQSKYDLNLFIWKDEHGVIIRQQLTFFGVVADWNIMEGARTGAVLEGERSRFVATSDTIQLDPKPNPLILEQARKITESATVLPDLDRGQCARNWVQAKVRGIGSFMDFFLRRR